MLKRLAREAFRHAGPDLPACDLILRLSKSPSQLNREGRRLLRNEIDELLTRVRVEIPS